MCGRHAGHRAIAISAGVIPSLLALREVFPHLPLSTPPHGSLLPQHHPSRVDLFLSAVWNLLYLRPLPEVETLSPLLPALLAEIRTDRGEVYRLLKVLSSAGDVMLAKLLHHNLLPDLLALLRDKDPGERSVREAVELVEVLFDASDSSVQPFLAQDIFPILSLLLSSPTDKSVMCGPACSRCLLKLLSRLPTETLHALLFFFPEPLLPRLLVHNDKDTIELINSVTKCSSVTGRSVLVARGALTYLVRVILANLHGADINHVTKTTAMLESVQLLVESDAVLAKERADSPEMIRQLNCSLAAAQRTTERKISGLLEEILAALSVAA
jgi:hypothetical protein